MSILRLPRTVYHDLRAHGEEAWPHECCGALLGRAMQEGGPDGWQVDSLVRTLNIRGDSSAGSSLDRYEIAPAELVGIVREASNRGLEIAGFYHSHPGHPAQPSATDLAEAHWIGCSYVITSVEQGRAARTNSFELAGEEASKQFHEEEITVESSSPSAAESIARSK